MIFTFSVSSAIWAVAVSAALCYVAHLAYKQEKDEK